MACHTETGILVPSRGVRSVQDAPGSVPGEGVPTFTDGTSPAELRGPRTRSLPDRQTCHGRRNVHPARPDQWNRHPGVTGHVDPGAREPGAIRAEQPSRGATMDTGSDPVGQPRAGQSNGPSVNQRGR